MSHAKQILVQHSPKKGSVRYEATSKDKHPLFQTVYLMRDGVEKALGVKKLDKFEKIEISVRVVGTKDADDGEEDEEEDE